LFIDNLRSIEGSTQLKFAANNFVVDKRVVPSKTVSNDLAFQNCFESLLGLENVVAMTSYNTQAKLALNKNVASHDLNDVTLGVATSPRTQVFSDSTILVVFDAVVAQKSTPLLIIAPDADIALESYVVPTLVAALVKDVVGLLEKNFLKECEIVVKYLKGKANMEDSLSDNEDDVVQTT